MKKIIFYIVLCLCANICFAQTARVYRGGTLIGTYTALADASAAANMIGDSIILSAHTFKEHNIPMKGGQIWQGTMTPIDTTIIDAESKGRISDYSIASKGRAITIRDIICTNGSTLSSGTKDGGAFYALDSLILRGRTIIRNSYAQRCGGGVHYAYAYDWVKITNNRSDSFGGGVGNGIVAFDSVEISYNTSRYGGGVGFVSGGVITCNSAGVRIHHNTATIAGGAIYGFSGMEAGQIIYNSAPVGAAIWTFKTAIVANLSNCYIYNPLAGGFRQNEIYTQSNILIGGSWFGKSDTIGLTTIISSPFGSGILGKYAIANWSVNRGKPLTKADTLFPIGAAFTYNDGTALPANACPWLVGNFSSSTGKLLTPNPKISATDTMSSLFRTYVYPTKGDTTSKPINFVCIVDGDTFRTSPRVWGIDSIKLGITNAAKETQVMVYPNPAQEVMNIQGVESGSSIELYDVMGKLVLQKLCDSSLTQFDVNHLAKGTYNLKIITKEGNEGSAKVMKE